jgi:hypothetical protein
LRQRDRGCCFCALKKKEIAAATGGWGVTEYLQLDWMDDGTDGWMEKASRRPLLYVISTAVVVVSGATLTDVC